MTKESFINKALLLKFMEDYSNSGEGVYTPIIKEMARMARGIPLFENKDTRILDPRIFASEELLAQIVYSTAGLEGILEIHQDVIQCLPSPSARNEITEAINSSNDGMFSLETRLRDYNPTFRLTVIYRHVGSTEMIMKVNPDGTIETNNSNLSIQGREGGFQAAFAYLLNLLQKGE